MGRGRSRRRAMQMLNWLYSDRLEGPRIPQVAAEYQVQAQSGMAMTAEVGKSKFGFTVEASPKWSF